MTLTMSGRPGARRRVIAAVAAAAVLAALAACSGVDPTRSAATVDPIRPGPQVMAEQPAPDDAIVPAGAGAVPAPLQPSTPAAAEPVPPPAPPPAPEPAATPTTVPGSDDGRAVQRLDDPAAVRTSAQALGLLRVDWRTMTPGWQIRFLPARAGLRGATFPDLDIIEIYVRSTDRPADLAHVVAHELGHAVDVSRFGDAERRAWTSARGIASGTPWFASGSAVPDFASPAGDWAESFAYWLVGSGWYSQLGPPPNAAQGAMIARLAGVG